MEKEVAPEGSCRYGEGGGGIFNTFDAMYSRLQLAKKYVYYYFTALNGKGHGIHSPFVFDFVRNVLTDTGRYDAYTRVEALRTKLLQDKAVLEVRDLGAGSVVTKQRQRKVADIARHAAKPAKYGQLLFRMARYYKPPNSIELGTSLGITTAYLALGGGDVPVITLEGAEAVARVAEVHFRQLELSRVRCITGDFDATLPQALQVAGRAGLVFIDGNHRKAPTVRYFHTLLPSIEPASILIFDDIHWSREMEEAWEEIRQHPAVKLSIDLFFIGMVFFREEFTVKQHFVIRF